MPVGDTLKRATNQMSIVSQKDIDNNIGFLALRQFINDNPELKVVLVRMPLYTENNSLSNEDKFQKFIGLLIKENENISFVDFYKLNILFEAEYFYDWDHLNAKGADSLYNYRLSNNIIF